MNDDGDYLDYSVAEFCFKMAYVVPILMIVTWILACIIGGVTGRW